jgi:hypothetical protein
MTICSVVQCGQKAVSSSTLCPEHQDEEVKEMVLPKPQVGPLDKGEMF